MTTVDNASPVELLTSHAEPNAVAGFTLVEIAVAVAILGVALVSLIGLHTRMVNTYINETNRFQAALTLQYIASILETEPEPPAEGSTQELLVDRLSKLGYFDGDSSAQKSESRFEGWQFEQQVDSLSLPFQREELAEDAIRQISMRVVWGPSDDEEFTMVYFLSPPLDPATGPTSPTGSTNPLGGVGP